MCWSSKVSLNTFLFSLFGILFAYFNNVIGLFDSLYYLSFVSIQLMEYFTWRNMNDRKMNGFLSRVGLFLIFIQIPLFILSFSKVESSIKTALIAMYLIFSLLVGSYYQVDFSMTKAPNGHLAWNWLKFPTFIMLIWLVFMFCLFVYDKQYITFVVYSVVVFAIYYTYHKTNTWGSLWCWLANILALRLVLQVFLGVSSDCFLYTPTCLTSIIN